MPEEYYLAVAASFGPTAPRVFLWFDAAATPHAHVRGMAHACTLRHLLAADSSAAASNAGQDFTAAHHAAIVRRAHNAALALDVERVLEGAGWDLGVHHLAAPDSAALSRGGEAPHQ